MKRQLVAVLTSIALLLAVSGASGVVGDALGYGFTAQVYACNNGGHSGGGC
jgi:hypothetical protein